MNEVLPRFAWRKSLDIFPQFLPCPLNNSIANSAVRTYSRLLSKGGHRLFRPGEAQAKTAI